MGVRNESVRVSAEDAGFTTSMARFTTAAAVFGSTLDHIDGSGIRVQQTLPGVAKEVDGLGRAARTSGPEIDRYSGRVRILADAFAILGPSAVPIGAVAVPAVAGLASQLGFAAIGATTLIAAAQGVGDALSAVNEAAVEPTAANLEKAQQAMDRLGPDAQAFVTEFQRIRPTLQLIRDSGAAGWFPGLTESLDDLERLGPQLADISQAIGERGGALIAEGAENLAGPEWAEFMAFVEANAPEALEQLLRTVGNVTRGVAEMWMAFDPVNDDFGNWLLDQSRDFARWSDELSSTTGYHEFVDYIETNGPRVADAAGAVANAVLQIIEAVAPLGGPSLKIIETFADAIAAIADSDLGTPILAGVAALALYTRGLQAAAALQTKLTGSQALSGALAAGGVFGATKTGAAGLKSSIPTVSQFGTVMYRAGQSSKYASEQTLAARSAVRGFAAQAAKGAAPVAGLAVATSGVADGFGLANTASLGLMGTIAGPWGAAIGAGIGLMKDLDAATIGFSDNVKQVEADISSGGLADAADRLAELRKQAKDSNEVSGFGDFFSDFGSGMGRVLTGDLGFLVGADEDKIEQLERFLAKAKEAKATEAAFAESLRSGNAAATAAEEGINGLIQALNRYQTEALTAIDGQYAWGAAVMSAREQMKNGSNGFSEFTEAGQQNMAVVRSLATAWNENMDALQKSGTSYKDARRQIVEFAVGQGMLREEAQALARDLLAVPEEITPRIAAQFDRANFREAKAAFDSLPVEVRTNILAHGIPKTEADVDALVAKYKLTEKERRALVTLTDKASAALRVVQARLDGLRDKNVTVTTTFKNFYDNVPKPGKPGKKTPSVPQVPGLDGTGADGATVPKTGRPYADRHLYLLADGERVTSNRYGQVDQSRRALDLINSGQLNDRILGLADGGTAGRRRRGGRDAFLVTPALEPLFNQLDFDHLSKSAKRLMKSFEASKAALDNELSARQALGESLASAVTDRLTSPLFGQSDAWSTGNSYEDVMAKLAGDTAAGNGLLDDIASLRAKGLDETALAALLAEADNATIDAWADLSAAQLQSFEDAFNTRTDVVARSSQAAVEAAFGAGNAPLLARVDQLTAEIKVLQDIERGAPKEVGKETGGALKKSAGKGFRSIKKGGH